MFKEKILTGDYAVNCRTQEQAETFLAWLDEKMIGKGEYSNDSYWRLYGENTAYYVNRDVVVVADWIATPCSCVLFYEEALAEETYTRGERVLVRDEDKGKWLERIYLATIEGSIAPYIVVSIGYANNFEEGRKFNHVRYKQIKKKPQKKVVNLDEVRELLREKYGNAFELNLGEEK